MFFSDLGAGRNENAYIGFFHPEAIRRQQQIVKTFFDTPNPYRNNICPKDDPTVAIYEIENERTFIWMNGNDPNIYDWKKLSPGTRELLYQKWADFLSQKYGSIENLKKAWNRSDLNTLKRAGRLTDTFADHHYRSFRFVLLISKLRSEIFDALDAVAAKNKTDFVEGIFVILHAISENDVNVIDPF